MTTLSFENWQKAALEQLEVALAQALDFHPQPSPRLMAAMRYSLMAGGKRLRPLLCLAACELSGKDNTKALTPACAVEILHTYSLIHDDLPAMDDDDLRRGKPSCHKAFDEATAILAGDALQTLAFDLLASHGDHTDAQRLAMLRTLAQATGAAGMVAGQMQDMEAEGRALALAELEEMHCLKTGRLIEASLLLGAQAAGIDDTRQLARMRQIGQLLGLAFQVQDDILDVTGNTSELGKASGADAALGKSTFPALLGLEQSQAYARNLCQQALDLLGTFGEPAVPLLAITRLMAERQH